MIVGGLRDRVTVQTADQGLLLVFIGQLPGIGRQEGQTVVIEQSVHDNTQGIKIHAEAVRLSLVDFRRHIAGSTCAGHARHGLFHCLGNAEITEFEISGIRHKNVVRLDISVDNIVLLASLQSLAQVNAHFYHFFFEKLAVLSGNILIQGL